MIKLRYWAFCHFGSVTIGTRCKAETEIIFAIFSRSLFSKGFRMCKHRNPHASTILTNSTSHGNTETTTHRNTPSCCRNLEIKATIYVIIFNTSNVTKGLTEWVRMGTDQRLQIYIRVLQSISGWVCYIYIVYNAALSFPILCDQSGEDNWYDRID